MHHRGREGGKGGGRKQSRKRGKRKGRKRRKVRRKKNGDDKMYGGGKGGREEEERKKEREVFQGVVTCREEKFLEGGLEGGREGKEGKYELRLSDAGGQRRGSKAGLGLRVLDAYTGEEREVSSLSGGETFQASLALALGVADAVQAHSGGVALNALFIDEGFGSLDPDSLQLAMDELDRLREGGRLIGLISHVGALRERIRSGLQVVASERGSRVVVGHPGVA